jgi:hypothetical protein
LGFDFALPLKRMLGVPGSQQLLVDLAGEKDW